MMWATKLAYMTIWGKPGIFWSGLILGVFFLITFLVPVLNRRKITKIPMKVHFICAWITLLLALFHGIVGIFVFL